MSAMNISSQVKFSATISRACFMLAYLVNYLIKKAKRGEVASSYAV